MLYLRIVVCINQYINIGITFKLFVSNQNGNQLIIQSCWICLGIKDRLPNKPFPPAQSTHSLTHSLQLKVLVHLSHSLLRPHNSFISSYNPPITFLPKGWFNSTLRPALLSFNLPCWPKSRSVFLSSKFCFRWHNQSVC